MAFYEHNNGLSGTISLLSKPGALIQNSIIVMQSQVCVSRIFTMALTAAQPIRFQHRKHTFYNELSLDVDFLQNILCQAAF